MMMPSKAESSLQGLIEAFATPIFVKDREHRWIMFNEAFCRLLGRPRGEIVGKSDYDFFPKSEADVFWEKDELVFTTGVENVNDEPITAASGAVRELTTTKTRFTDSRGAQRLVGVIRDTTEQKRAVEELRKLESLRAEVAQRRELAALKDEFIGTVSHELRTPLALVMTAIDSLRKGLAGPLTAKQRDVAELANRNIVRLGRMINNLLDISRLEAGTAKSRFERLDINALLADLEANYHMMGRAKTLKLEIKAPEELPEVRADREMIMQVLDILLDNAERFGTSAISVKASSTGKGVRIEVIDNGVGVPPDRVRDLFNKFSQVARSVGGGYKGTGLGLAICKEIMLLHGSTIEVDSPPGSGARFHFTLPAWNADVPRSSSGRKEVSSHG